MGGHIAAELAADFPERVGRLVLASAAAMPFGDGYARHVAGLVRSVRRGGRGHLPVLVADAWRAGPRTILTAARELMAADISPKLERIEAPTLLVWGEDDPLVPLDHGRRLLERLHDADLVVIRAAGHNVMLDSPEEFNHVVLGFLETPLAVAAANRSPQ
jgi:pimeloyl-ACP methyl ester carboxylesterase